jgi:hypothetical protein
MTVTILSPHKMGQLNGTWQETRARISEKEQLAEAYHHQLRDGAS